MFYREMMRILKKYQKFPAIALLGPRQSGKTTLAQEAFPQHVFLSLDKESTRTFALEDPEGFLSTHENEHGIILDEFQYAPQITSYIKREVDNKKRPGYFILTGSQNFLMNQAITESLAGRVGILNLLPLSLQELHHNKILSSDVDTVCFNGFYPRLYNEHFSPAELYPSYIQSYIERDVRQLINVGNLALFQKFIQLCAGRTGQLLNINALADECGVSFPTMRQWLSILQASYIIFLLEPHFKNFNKRLVKTPKLYFYDTGVACSLLRISSPQQLSLSPFRGALFENVIIADIYKQYCHRGLRPSLYFWRDRGGAHEVDCIMDEGITLYPIEIKASKTITSDFFKGLDYWNEIAQATPEKGFIIYAGSEKQLRKRGNILGWQDARNMVENVSKRQ